MKKTILYSSMVLFLILILSTICFSDSETMPLEKAFRGSKAVSETNSYIIGSFSMIHTKWDYYDKRLSPVENINSDCKIRLVLLLQNTSSNKVYELDFKPITGSNFPNYKKNRLAKNTEDPYWVLEVPPGKYALTTVSFKMFIGKEGYEYFFEKDMVTVPLSRDIKRNVTFEVQPKQIVYIGDYFTEFKTNIILHDVTILYPYNHFKVILSDNFDKTKEILFNRANTSETLENYEIVSAL